MSEMAPKRSRRIFPINQDPTNMLERTDLHSENVLLGFFKNMPFPVSVSSRWASFGEKSTMIQTYLDVEIVLLRLEVTLYSFITFQTNIWTGKF